MKNKVSVIIPTYKRSLYIDRAIKSVLNQTYKNIEILVIDDNDEDSIYRKDMEKYMEKYKKFDNINYIKHKKNMNGSAARNTGIRNSTGDFITFLDDDDFYLPRRIEMLVDTMLKNPNYQGAYTGSIILKNNKIVDVTYGNKSGNLMLDILKQYAFYRTGSNMFFKRECFDVINGFDETFLRHQDLEFMARFFEHYNIIGLPDILVIKDSNDSMNPNILKAVDYRKKFLQKYSYLISNFNSNDIRSIYYSNITSLMKLSLENKNITVFRKLKKKLIEYGCKYSFKLIINNKLYYLSNFFPIKKIRHFFYNNKWKRKIDKDVLKQINYLVSEKESW